MTKSTFPEEWIVSAAAEMKDELRKQMEQPYKEEIERLQGIINRYIDVMFEIGFCCGAIGSSLEQQSEALKAIYQICKDFYSVEDK